MVIPPILLTHASGKIADTHHNMFSLVSGFTSVFSSKADMTIGNIPGTFLQVGCI